MRAKKYGKIEKRRPRKIEKRRKHSGRRVKEPKNVEELDEMAEGSLGDTPI